MVHRLSKSLAAKLERVRILFCDVDGVLTDATVLLGEGQEFKSFHIRDGLGLHLLRQAGILVAWISNRPSTATEQRAKELKVDYLHQAKDNKVVAAERILQQAGLNWTQACYVGDDVVDLGAMKRAGTAVAVANAVPFVRAQADYVTHAEGGHGAVREIIDLILEAQNKWPTILQQLDP